MTQLKQLTGAASASCAIGAARMAGVTGVVIATGSTSAVGVTGAEKKLRETWCTNLRLEACPVGTPSVT